MKTKNHNQTGVEIINIYMKYFGTDGIRGVVDQNLSPSLLRRIAKAGVQFIFEHNLRPVILVGNDSRESSDYILSIMSAVFLKHGVEIHNVGICSSPCLAFLTKSYNYPLGMMISASHNSHEYNGIKFFNNHGEKLSAKIEENFEFFMDKNVRLKISYSKMVDKSKLKQDYTYYLKNLMRGEIPCIIDCASGGASEIIKRVFPHEKKLNASPNGKNINLNAGCTHIDMLKNQCIKKRMLGFAVDGDGDRVTFVDEHGEIIAGDKILYILSKFFLKSKEKIVGTIYTNSGLMRSLKKRGITLLRANVGDKQVYELMKKDACLIGGENSGHIIIKPFTNTGDGVLTAILVMNIIATTGKTLSELLIDYEQDFQIIKNFNEDINLKSEELKLAIQKYEDMGARIIIRKSGTEPVFRIMIEHENLEFLQKILKNIENLLNF